jgi:hypothetical protein
MAIVRDAQDSGIRPSTAGALTGLLNYLIGRGQ